MIGGRSGKRAVSCPIGRDVHLDAARRTLWPRLEAVMFAVSPLASILGECRECWGRATHDPGSNARSRDARNFFWRVRTFCP